eukprot:359616-Chlamydomonas_euryale.AAC.1
MTSGCGRLICNVRPMRDLPLTGNIPKRDGEGKPNATGEDVPLTGALFLRGYTPSTSISFERMHPFDAGCLLDDYLPLSRIACLTIICR